MRREADDGARAELQSRVGRREIVLPDMHAGGTARAREIDSIVDDDLRAVRFGRADDAVAEIEEETRGEPLGAQLKKSCPAVQIRPREFVRPPTCPFSELDVDDGLELRH